MDFATQLEKFRQRVEDGLRRHLPPATTRPGRLHEAMRYSLDSGGKRLRPVLVFAAAELHPAGSGRGALDPVPAAVAVECVHTYSLIHDDLPCMDDDDLRRGRPTVHKAFDEATAVLAGDALLTHAFALLAGSYAADPAVAAELCRELAQAAGSTRLIGGQMADLIAEGKGDTSVAELEFIHLNKTAAMIEASLVMGGIVGRASAEAIGELRLGGRALGLAFQVLDDILDVTATTSTLGKTAGKDVAAGKATYVAIHGLEAARSFAAKYTAEAIRHFGALRGDSSFLVALARQMASRGS